MSDENKDVIEVRGTIVEQLPNAVFNVVLENGHKIMAYTCGKMRRFRVKVVPGDIVDIVMTPYDLKLGRIVFRHK